MKGFLKKRLLDERLIEEIDAVAGEGTGKRLQKGLPAISLAGHISLLTAVINDLGADLIFAQQVIAVGEKNDLILGISTSGNADNILKAFAVAKALGLKTIAFTGMDGGKMGEIADITIKAPSKSTPSIQEYHIKIYHALCAQVEQHFFKE